jgi:hypothetical protein
MIDFIMLEKGICLPKIFTKQGISDPSNCPFDSSGSNVRACVGSTLRFNSVSCLLLHTVEAAAQALAASESNSGPDNLPEPTPAQPQAAGEALRNKAAEPLATNPELRQKLVELQHAAEVKPKVRQMIGRAVSHSPPVSSPMRGSA